jgi:hypothetical protein
MKVVLAALALVATVVVGLVAFALLNLRALVGVHQDRLVAQVEEALGRKLTVATIAPSWWPLGVRLRDVTVGEDPALETGTPFLAADGLVMGVEAWPLVHGRVEVAGVTLERPRIQLIRARTGRWNVESLGESPPEASGSGGSKSKERRFSFRVPVEWVVGVALSQVHDGTVSIDDRRAAWSSPLVFRHVRIRAENVRFGATARVRVDAAVLAQDTPDMHLDFTASELGQHDLEHAPFTARLAVDEADLGEIGGRLGRADMLSGRLRSLTIDAEQVPTGEPMRLAVALETVDPKVRFGATSIGTAEPVAVRIAATGQRTMTIEELRVGIGGLTIRGHGDASIDPEHMRLDLESESGGTAAFSFDHTVVTVGALHGQVAFDSEGASLTPLAIQVDAIPLELRGWVTGIDPPALDLHLESRPFAGICAAELAIDASGAARARVEATAIDLASAVARFAPELTGAITGMANGAAVLTGRVTGGTLDKGSVGGNGTLTVTGGRLRNVNLPELVVDQIEQIPLMPTIVSDGTRARYAELFGIPDTIVESASVPFTIARGRFATERAVLVNPAYQITGDGWIDEARALRFHGTVLLGASVSRTLRDDVHAAKYLAEDDGRIALLGAVRVEPDGKRLRMRGLQALLGDPADGAAAPQPPAERKKKDRRHDDENLEEKVIERLEKLLRP